MTFNDITGTYFWSNGYAYGTVDMQDTESGKKMELSVLNGQIRLSRITIESMGKLNLPEMKTLAVGKKAVFTIKRK
ncbi:unnamed protein product [marine sediment metagenome]|uniref:Uncharacterized protein n=1 Tax=marine sediment metagenome TaxID=412755 RepID=X0Y413_9ZZZZ